MSTMDRIGTMLESVRAGAERSGVFARVGIEENGRALVCAAKASAAPAFYRVDAPAEGLSVSLVMADRWLSQSIEADLVNTGDSMEDLLGEELVELGVVHQGRELSELAIEHYRSEAKLFTFLSRLPADVSGDTVLGCLLAYEACFRRLGDMEADGEDE